MDHDNEPTLRDLIALLRRGLLIAFGAALIAGVATFFISRTLPPSYEARATLVASAQDPNQRDFGVTLVTAPTLDVATYQAAIRSRQVLAESLRVVTGTTPSSIAVDELDGSLTVRAEDARTSSLLRVLVRDEDPHVARDLANAIAAAAVRWDEQRATRSLETIVASLQAQIASIDAELTAAGADTPVEGLVRNRAELQLQLSSARALRTAAVGRLELLEAAEAPRERVAPRPTRNAALAALLAVFLTYGLLLLRDALDTRVRGPEDLARITDLPVLAEFPRVATGRRGLPMEAASYLRTAVSFATHDVHPKIIMVTSTDAGHGKSSVSMALAESFARQHYMTLLIDADLRKPVIGKEYGLSFMDHQSLRDALDDIGGAEPTRILIAEGVEFDVLPSFEPAPNPTELLANWMRPLLERMRPHYDVIIIDSAPVLPVADALTVAPHASGVIFAVSVPDADRRSVQNGIDLLRRVGVKVFGTVASNISAGKRGAGGYGYGYGYGAGYGASETANGEGEKRRRAQAVGARRPASDDAFTSDPRIG